MSDKNLGFDDIDGGEIGEVDLFGLDEFGQVVGMNPMWGAVIGGGLGTGSAIAVRALVKPDSSWFKYSEGIGFLVGGLASGVMMAFPGTRAAGWAGLATAFVTNGLRQIEGMFGGLSGYQGVQIGAVVPEQIQGYGNFGAVVPEQIQGYGGYNDFGAVVPEQIRGIAGAQLGADKPPVDLMAAGALPASAEHVGIMGGPALSGLGAHYGATLFGGN